METLNDLSDLERKNLSKTHKRHTSTMGYEEQQRHSINNIIEKVERNHEEKCFHVHFKHDEWYHYTWIMNGIKGCPF